MSSCGSAILIAVFARARARSEASNMSFGVHLLAEKAARKKEPMSGVQAPVRGLGSVDVVVHRSSRGDMGNHAGVGKAICVEIPQGRIST